MASQQSEDTSEIEEITPKVFTNDVIHFKSLVNKIVEVETLRGPTVHKGILYTIDPVSETIVLLNRAEESLTMTIVMAFDVKNIKCVESSNVPLIPDNLFTEDWAKHLTEKEVEEKRTKLKEWLVKNQIPIEESDKVLKLDDILTIEPPYGPEQCMSSNEIVLSKIQNLIKSMPV